MKIIENFKFDEKYKTLFVNVSGGADSTILLYSLIKYLQSTGRTDTKIHLNTVMFHHYDSSNASTMKTVSNMIGFILEHTNAFSLIDSHNFLLRGNENGMYEGYGRYKVYKTHPSSILTDRNKLVAPTDASHYFLMEIGKIISSRPDKESCLLLSGKNQNPPIGTMVTAQSGKIVDMQVSSPYQHRNVGYEWVLNGKNGVHEYHPFGAIDKKEIIAIYKYFNVYDKLLPMTHSCASWNVETTNNFTTECGECWWCLEREWGME
jgi:7-cyano-7-deazaguanine synthase in queuosine biosynthesis